MCYVVLHVATLSKQLIVKSLKKKSKNLNLILLISVRHRDGRGCRVPPFGGRGHRHHRQGPRQLLDPR